MAVLTTELIGAKIDALRAEFIDYITAGTKGRFAWACAAYKAVSGCYLHTTVAAKSPQPFTFVLKLAGKAWGTCDAYHRSRGSATARLAMQP
jgi:hypothetical protein